MERELKRVKHGRLYLIPASEETRGHGTTSMATPSSSPSSWPRCRGERCRRQPGPSPRKSGERKTAPSNHIARSQVRDHRAETGQSTQNFLRVLTWVGAG